MTINKPVHINGIKQWQNWSEYAQEDPYKNYRRGFGSPFYVVDVDEREIRIIGGHACTVAYIERECSPTRIKSPLRYLSSFWHEPAMKLKLESLTRDAQKLDIPAFFVCHSADMEQFIVVRLPWNEKTFRQYTASQYKRFLMWLGQPAAADEEKTA